MDFPYRGLAVFVATRLEDVPVRCRRYLSVDGSVPGAALTWDHHVSGEPINLDAMPSRIDVTGYDGVGTTLADTDALASVVAVMAGGAGRLPPGARKVLRAASHRCDHLRPHPGIDEASDRLGRGLLGWVDDALAANAHGEVFAQLCAEVVDRIARGADLPLSTASADAMDARAARYDAERRIYRAGRVAWIDLRGEAPLAPESWYARVACPVGIMCCDHRQGGVQYTVGVNPFAEDAPQDLSSCLDALAAAERVHGPPALRATPGPGSENWGGRATVFGSPWNYGSRLNPEEVVSIIARTLSSRSA
jgi:hypothetical protein